VNSEQISEGVSIATEKNVAVSWSRADLRRCADPLLAANRERGGTGNLGDTPSLEFSAWMHSSILGMLPIWCG